MGAFDDLIPGGKTSSSGVFDDLIPKEPAGGLAAAAKQAIGQTIKGIGRAASDFIPGVTPQNPVSDYGQSVIDANPTAVNALSDIADKPWTAVKEAVGNAGGSMGAMLGARGLGMGITAAAPFTGPAAPVVAGAGQLIANVGPIVAAALPSYGGIRETQIQADPANEADGKSKAIAALGAGAVGAIETAFGPQQWALAAAKKGGLEALAKKFADAKSIPGAIGKGVVRGGAVEGAEELVQNPIEQVSGYQDPTTRQAIGETLFGGAMGAIGGGVLGGGMAGAAKALSPARVGPDQTSAILPDAVQAGPDQPPETPVMPPAVPLGPAPAPLDPAAGPLQKSLSAGGITSASATVMPGLQIPDADAVELQNTPAAQGPGISPTPAIPPSPQGDAAGVPTPRGITEGATPEASPDTRVSDGPSITGIDGVAPGISPSVESPGDQSPVVTPSGLAGIDPARDPDKTPQSRPAPTVPATSQQEPRNGIETQVQKPATAGREAQPAKVSTPAEDIAELQAAATRHRVAADSVSGRSRDRLLKLATQLENAAADIAVKTSGQASVPSAVDPVGAGPVLSPGIQERMGKRLAGYDDARLAKAAENKNTVIREAAQAEIARRAKEMPAGKYGAAAQIPPVADAPSPIEPTREAGELPVEMPSAAGPAPMGLGAANETQKSVDEIAKIIHSSIADRVIRRAKNNSTPDRAAEIENSWRNEAPGAHTMEMAKAIADRNPIPLLHVLVGAYSTNQGTARAFEKMTGYSLRGNSESRAKAIFDWAGWSEQQVADHVSEKREAMKASAGKRAEAEARAKVDAMKSRKYRTPDGGEISAADMISDRIASGYTEIQEGKQGAAKTWTQINPETQSGFRLRDKAEADYAAARIAEKSQDSTAPSAAPSSIAGTSVATNETTESETQSALPATGKAQPATDDGKAERLARLAELQAKRDRIKRVAVQLSVRGAHVAETLPAKTAAVESMGARLKAAKPDTSSASARVEQAGAKLGNEISNAVADRRIKIDALRARLEAAKPSPVVERETPVGETKSPTMQVADFIKGRLGAAQKTTWQELFDSAAKAWGSTLAEGKYTVKDVYDAMEAGVNLHIRDEGMLIDGDASEASQFARGLTTLIGLLPTQTKRTAEQDEFQQFSTPPALSYVASWVANISAKDTMMEPSAGTGDLAIWAEQQGARLILNELSARRAAILKELFPSAEVFTENAEQINNVLPAEAVPTVVVMNPPFSATAGRVQGSRDTMNGAKHIVQALKRLADGGRLVAIVGEGMAADRPAFKIWWMAIAREYNVRANIGIDGKEYAKYGTTFSNQILVIDKTGPTTGEIVTGNVSSVSDLPALLEGIRNDRLPTSQRAADQSQGAVAAEGNQGATGPSATTRVGATDVVVPGRKSGPATRALGTTAVGGKGPGRGTGKTAAPATGEERPTTVDAPTDADGKRGRLPDRPVGNGTGSRGNDAGGVNVSDSGAAATPEQGGLTDSVFENYTPQRLRVAGAKPHPGNLVQSAAMASVQPPAPTYTPNLPRDLIDGGKLSVAQIEAIVYAGQAHEQFLPNGERRGFFIGDGTGVGKGREIAGIILDNIRQGRKKAVWVSFSEGLINDAQRDFDGIGGDKGQIFWQGKTKPAQPITANEGILFTSYSTMKSAEKKQANDTGQSTGKTRLDQIVDWLGADFDGVIVFDEAHSMGNIIAIPGKRGVKKPSQQAIAGANLQKMLPKARIVYVSATGATEVSNLGYASRLGLWGEGTAFPGVREFITGIGQGGVAAMELISRDMKALGMYIARSLSFDGVTYQRLDHELTPLQTDIYNELARAWQGVLKNVNAALEITGGNKNGNAKSAAISAFWGSHQRFFNQVITSLQTPTVIDDMRKQIAAGNAIVVQLVNTNEATQEREVAKAQADGTELEELDFTPRQMLLDYVRNSFPVQAFEETTDDNGNKVMTPVSDAAGNPVFDQDAVAIRERLLKTLEQIRVPGNPIDEIIQAFGSDAVGEVTGRKRRFVSERGEDGTYRIVEEKRGKNAAHNDAAAFQGDKKKILIFSQAGGTGFSFHADNTAENKRKRVHYILQPGWRADAAVQGFGRTHRTNQASAPIYMLPTTSLKAQKRFVSSIARRLDQLGALTRGQRQATSQGLFSASDNLESQYAAYALQILFNDMYRGNSSLDFGEITGAMGLNGLIDQNGGLNTTKLPEIPQFLNRLLSLESFQQDAVFSEFEKRLDEVVNFAIQNGTYDTGLQTLRAQSIVKVRDEVAHTDKRTDAETRYVEIDVSNPIQYITRQKALEWANKYGHQFKGWFKNAKGEIFGLVHLGERINSDGVVSDRGIVLKIGDLRYIDNADKVHRNVLSTRIDDQDDAMTLLEEQVKAAPKMRTKRERMVVGVILPVWDRVQGNAKIVRLQTDAGERMIGRMMSEKEARQTVKNLGLGSSVSKLPTREIVDSIRAGSIAELANGWRIEQVTVSGEKRLEIRASAGYFTGGDTSILKDQGVFFERIGWQERAFIPTGKDGEHVFERVTESKPVVDLISKSGQSDDDSILYNVAGAATITPADSAIYNMAQEGKTAAEILKFIGQASRRPFNRYLANALRNLGAASTITLDSQGWFNFGNRSYAQKYAAAYSPRTDTVLLFTPREAERHILHELVHAATLKALAAGGPAAARMRVLLRYVQKDGSLSGQYGLSSLDEFVAEAFSNPKFQQALQAIPAPKGSTLKNAWEWFVRAVARILGMKTARQETLLDQVMREGAALMRENAAMTGRLQGSDRYAIAWHGTPHVWAPEPGFPHGRPRLDKMGTGEGAQAYGWGWYSAEAQRVAESYMEVGDKRKVSSITLDGQPLDMSHRPHVFARNALADNNGDISQAIAWLDETKQMPGMDRHAAAIEQAKKVVKVAVFNKPSSLYKLDIPDDVMPKLLDWDKPLSEQSPAVQEALRGSAIAPDESTWQHWTGQQLYEGEVRARTEFDGQAKGDARKLTSEQLASIGIPGLRYLDQGSRADGTGTYNYVIWDQPTLDRIALLERNGEKLDAIRAADEEVRFSLDTDAQFSDTERDAGGRSAYDKAKAAGRTKLNYGQWVQVRTPAFKAWFGDWEGDPENASKVVDSETGEPLVVYHGSESIGITKFDGSSLYLTTSKKLAKQYTGWESEDGKVRRTGEVVPLFVSTGEFPVSVDAQGARAGDIKISKKLANEIDEEEELIVGGHGFLDDIAQKAEGAGYTAVIFNNVLMNGKTNQDEVLSDVVVTFRPEQIKSATGNRGTFDANDPDIRYNLASDWPTSPHKAARTIREYVAAAMNGDANTSWLNPFQTQYHKAEKWAKAGKPAFKRLFDRVQQFISDVSRYAITAQAAAPTLMHEVKSAKDVAKALTGGDPFGRQLSADIQAISMPIYDGTLYGGGNPMSGVRWNDERLRALYQLNDRQIKLYNEALDAIGVSLDEFTKSIIAKHAMQNGVDFDRDLGLEDMAAGVVLNIEQSRSALATENGFLEAHIEDAKSGEIEIGDDDIADYVKRNRKQIADNQKKSEQLEKIIQDVRALADKADRLKKAGYFPLSRFGRHTVTARDADGKVQHFSMHGGIPLVPRSGQVEANRVAAAIRQDHPDWKVETGLMNTEKFRLFEGVNPNVLKLFADHLDPNTSEVFQEYLRVATTDNSAMKRLLHRKGTPGFDRDIRRSLAQFIVSHARATSANYHNAAMLAAAESAEDDGGDIGGEAIKLYKYVQEPQEEAAALRGFLFFNFLGGSLASAMVNATQVPMMTFPTLSQYEAAGKLAARLGRAAKIAVKNPADIQGPVGEALRLAEMDGVTAPQEIHQMMATASDNIFAGSRGANYLMRIWGAPFALAESFNRRTTFVAAFGIASDMAPAELEKTGFRTAFEFAEDVVNRTQGIYNKGNRPNVGRGAVGSTMMTFRQFSVMYLELLSRLPRKQQAIMLGVLALAAGGGGLPFAEDIGDILDTIGQWLGYQTNSSRWANEKAGQMLGKPLADLTINGVLSQMGVDLQSRLGAHNLLPGSAILKMSSVDKGRDIQDFFGPAASVVASLGKALENLATGKPGTAALDVAPVAIQNAFKGGSMMASGHSSDAKGRTGVPVNPVEGFAKGIGFNPKSVADFGSMKRDITQDQRLLQVRREGFTSDIVDAVVAGDQDAKAAALMRWREWNRSHPEARISIDAATIRRRVADIRRTAEQRLVRSLPKGLKPQGALQ